MSGLPQWDDALAAAIESGRVVKLDSLRGVLPNSFLDSLQALLSTVPTPAEPYRLLARSFTAMGFRKAAITCLGRALSVTAAAAERAALLEQRAALAGENAEAELRVAARLRGEVCAAPNHSESQASNLRTLSIWIDPGRHLCVRDHVPCHPLRNDPLRDPWKSKPFRLGKIDITMGGIEDLSFLVLDGERPVLHVESTIEGDGPLACLQAAIQFTVLAPASDAAYRLAIDHLCRSAHQAVAPFILVETDGTEPEVLRDWVLRFAQSSRTLEWAWVDLAQTEEAIWAGFRSTFRRHIRWGRRNLDIRRWAGSEDDMLAHDYIALCMAHSRVLAQSVDELLARLKQRDVDLYISAFEGRPVNGLIIAHHGVTSYYEGGISYKVENYPFSHTAMAHGNFRRSI